MRTSIFRWIVLKRATGPTDKDFVTSFYFCRPKRSLWLTFLASTLLSSPSLATPAWTTQVLVFPQDKNFVCSTVASVDEKDIATARAECPEFDDAIQHISNRSDNLRQWEKPLLPIEIAAIRSYKASGFIELNLNLRSEQEVTFPAYTKMICKALNSLSEFSGTVYRGAAMSLEKARQKFIVGQPTLERSFLSTSTSTDVAWRFLSMDRKLDEDIQRVKIKFTIQSKHGKLLIGDHESEVIFGAGSRFFVKSVEPDPDVLNSSSRSAAWLVELIEI